MKIVSESEEFDTSNPIPRGATQNRINIVDKSTGYLSDYYDSGASSEHEIICAFGSDVPKGYPNITFSRNLVVNTTSGSQTLTVQNNKVDWDQPCGEILPKVIVVPEELIFTPTGPTSQTVFVSGNDYIDDITVECNDPDVFSATPTFISKEDATSTGVMVTITCSATEDIESMVNFKTSGGTGVSVSYKVPKTIEFTDQCKIEGTGVFLYFDGYGTTYERTKGKYTPTVTSTNLSISSIGVQDAAGAYLYCTMNATPLSTDITTVTLTYENGDTGVITFKGTQILNPSMSVSPTEWTCMAQGASNEFTVTAEALKQDISITSSSDKFTLSTPAISKDATFPQNFTVTCATFAAGESATITLTSGSLTKTITITTKNPEPIITVSPTVLALNGKNKSGVVTLSAQYLTSDITVTSSNSDITVDKSSITKEEANAGAVEITVTSKATADVVDATITFASEGATSKTATVSYTAPKEIVFTSSCKFVGAGAWIYFNGYGSTYQKDNTKYTVTSKSTNAALNTVNYFNCDADKFYVTYSAAPGATDITTITITYENGDTGSVTFKGSSVLNPSMSVSPTEWICMAQGASNEFTVTAEALKQDISITSSSDKFTLSTPSISKDATFPQNFTVTCATFAAGENETITLTSGSLTKTVAITTKNPEPVINVSPTSLSLNGKTKSGVISVTPQYLTNDIIITSSNADITVEPATISKDATGTVDVTITSNATTDVTGAIITFASEGATSKTATVNYTAPKEIVFTSSCKIVGTGIFLYFNGYQEGTYAHNKDKYDVSINSSKGAKTIRVENPAGGYLYCVMSGIAPEDTEINTITLTYNDNGDTGTITFKGTDVLDPSMSVSPTSLVFMAEGSKTVTVTAEALKEGISITCSSSDFSISPDFIPAGVIVSQDVTITCNEFNAAEDFDIIFTSGSLNQSVNIKTINPTPTLSVTPTSALFREVGDNVVVSVDAEYLSEDISIAYDGDLFTVSPASIPANSTFPVNVTITNKATEAVIEDVTFSSGTLTESVSVTVTPNTPCNGLYDKFAEAEKQAAFQYAYGETPDGYLSIVYTFENELSGLNPQLSFNGGANWKGMTNLGNRQYSYTTNSADHTASVDFSFKLLIAYTGHGPVVDVDYQFGTCPAPEVKPIHNVSQNKWYDLFADAMTEAASGDQFALYGDITESAVINKSIKLNGRDKTLQSVSVDYNGKLEIIGATNINTFIIKSIPNVGAGQVYVSGVGSVQVEEAYMERQIYSGAYQQFWYSLSVPFTVDANEGLYTVDGNKISKNTCFFTEYDGSLRAQYGVATLGQPGYAWVETTNLIRGKAYMIYIMDETINTLRLKASNPSELFNNVEVEAVAFTRFEGAAEATNWGWNFMAQPRLQNAETQVTAGAWGGDVLIQVLENGGNDAGSDGGGSYYKTKPTAGLILAPFTSFMFQASATGNMNFLYNAAAEPTVKSAEAIEYKYFIVNLSDENGNSDNFFASASEDAKIEGYELGRDLVKCGSSDNNLQICSSDFGLILTANDARLNGGVAEMPLRLSIPKAGNYSLQVTRAATFGNIYLTKNGEVIADLTDGEAYQFAAAKGVNNQFGLRIENGGDITTTAGDEKADINVYATEGIIYVNGVKAAEVRNMLGQQVNNQNLHRGAYMVNVEGSIIKINVE